MITTGWAVVYPKDRGFGSPGAPVLGTIEGTRIGAIDAFVERWRTRDDVGKRDAAVWRRAYRRGWRCARVTVRPWGEQG